MACRGSRSRGRRATDVSRRMFTAIFDEPWARRLTSRRRPVALDSRGRRTDLLSGEAAPPVGFRSNAVFWPLIRAPLAAADRRLWCVGDGGSARRRCATRATRRERWPSTTWRPTTCTSWRAPWTTPTPGKNRRPGTRRARGLGCVARGRIASRLCRAAIALAARRAGAAASCPRTRSASSRRGSCLPSTSTTRTRRPRTRRSSWCVRAARRSGRIDGSL